MLLKRIKIDIENIASVDHPVDCLTTKKNKKIFLLGILIKTRVSGFFLQSNKKLTKKKFCGLKYLVTFTNVKQLQTIKKNKNGKHIK